MSPDGLIGRVPGMIGGRPTLRGRRLTVFNLIFQSCHADDERALREYLADFELTLLQLRAAVTYCAGLHCLTDAPDGPFCEGCNLQFQQDGPYYDVADLEEFTEDESTYVRSRRNGNIVIFGSLADYLRDEQGVAGWLMAADIEQRFGHLLAE